MNDKRKRAARTVQPIVRLSDKPITRFPWEQKEYAMHIEEMHRQKAMADFLRASIVSLAKRVNDPAVTCVGPMLASCLLDMVDDCDKQIGAVKPNKALSNSESKLRSG